MAFPWLAAATLGAGIFSGIGAARGAKQGAQATMYGANKQFAASKYGTDAGAWSQLMQLNNAALGEREAMANAKQMALFGVDTLDRKKARNKREDALNMLSIANSPQARDVSRFQSMLNASASAYPSIAKGEAMFGPTGAGRRFRLTGTV
jgi:hypothetical protein